MTYNYKTKQLLDTGVNFAAIYMDKQARVKEMTGFDFSLPDIVRFLQTETNNFQNSIELAIEIDNAIYGIYNKWYRETSKPQEEPEQPKQEQSEQAKIYLQAIEDLKTLIEIEDDEELIAQYRNEIDDIETLLSLES